MTNFKKQTVRFVALLLVAIMLTCALVSCTKASEVDVLRTENFSVSAAMVTYSLYDTYHYYYNQFGEEQLLYYLGIDPNKPLDKQYSDEKGVTWFDVFKTDAVNSFCDALSLCEAALAAGIELTELDRKYIDAEIDAIEQLANKDGLTLKKYIKNVYGNNVKEEDIRKSLELYRLANKMRYKEYCSVNVTPEDIKEIVDKEGHTFLQRDVIYFDLTLSNDAAKTAKIKEYAAKLKEAKTEEEFRSIVDEFLKSEYCVNKDTKKKVLEKTVYNNVEEDMQTAVDRWFFASGTSVGKTYLVEGNSSHTVYMAVGDAVMDETPTRNMYTIVLEPFGYGTLDDCKAKAEEIYNKWKADGAKLEDFKALVRQYSTDDVSVFADGLYSNIKKGDMIDELDAWLFGKDTEVGAHTFMSTKYGCHIVYYSGDGEPAWKAPVIDQIKESKVSSVIYSYTEKYPVTQVEGNMKYVKAN